MYLSSCQFVLYIDKPSQLKILCGLKIRSQNEDFTTLNFYGSLSFVGSGLGDLVACFPCKSIRSSQISISITIRQEEMAVRSLAILSPQKMVLASFFDPD